MASDLLSFCNVFGIVASLVFSSGCFGSGAITSETVVRQNAYFVEVFFRDPVRFSGNLSARAAHPPKP